MLVPTIFYGHRHIAAIGVKNRQVCPHQSVGDQIRHDRRIKSPGVSLALSASKEQGRVGILGEVTGLKSENRTHTQSCTRTQI